MKPGASSLNPYAAAYIPLCKREADGGTCVAHNDHENYEGHVEFQTPQHTTQDQHPLHPNTRASQKLSTSQSYHVKSQPESSSSSTAAQGAVQMADKQMLDEESDMDLEYLRMTFPGISDQSLSDVYMVNGGDLEAAIDMLSLLELDVVQSSESLPETLDIGDISESGNSADSASIKLKKAAAEAGTSSPAAPATISFPFGNERSERGFKFIKDDEMDLTACTLYRGHKFRRLLKIREWLDRDPTPTHALLIDAYATVITSRLRMLCL